MFHGPGQDMPPTVGRCREDRETLWSRFGWSQKHQHVFSGSCESHFRCRLLQSIGHISSSIAAEPLPKTGTSACCSSTAAAGRQKITFFRPAADPLPAQDHCLPWTSPEKPGFGMIDAQTSDHSTCSTGDNQRRHGPRGQTDAHVPNSCPCLPASLPAPSPGRGRGAETQDARRRCRDGIMTR